MASNSKKKMYTNVPTPGQDEFQDEFLLIQSIENFNTKSLYFPSFDLLNFLVLNNAFPKSKIATIIRYIDSDEDGFISILDIISYLLHKLKHRSTKLTFKYLSVKIYKVFKLNSSEDFFIKNNIDVYKEILINDLCKFLETLGIESPISKAIYDEMKIVFPDPITYKQLGELIDEYKEDGILAAQARGLDYIDNNSNQKIDMKLFEDSMRKIADDLIDEDDYITNDYLKAKSMRENLKTILDNCDNVMNMTQYNLNFAKPLKIDPFIALTLFQLLKSISPSGEQLIAQKDLICFLESYISSNESIFEDEDEKLPKQIENVDKIVYTLEKNGPPLKYAFEQIPFCPSGSLSVCEFKHYLYNFYSYMLTPKKFYQVVKELDSNRNGVISYQEMQMFINQYSSDSFSVKIEIEFIASELLRAKSKFKSVNDYFSQEDFQSAISNYNSISRDEHKILLSDLATSSKNRNELFDYLCRRSNNENGYDIILLINLIEKYYLQEKEFEVMSEELLDNKEEVEKLKSTGTMPDKKIIEQIMREISLGEKGKISVYEFVMKLSIEDRNTVSGIIDKQRRGYVNYVEFVNLLRDIYGSDINLNYKLCSQYMYLTFIKKPDRVDDFILERAKSDSNDIDKCISHDTFYSNFLFGFANDKYLLETFYTIYKEKKGKNSGLINLKSVANFIKHNNVEVMNYMIEKEQEEDTESESPEKTAIKCKESSIITIQSIIKEHKISVKELLDMINIQKSDLKNNFTIKEKYISTILGADLNFEDEDLNLFLEYFRFETGRFDIKKLFNFDPEIQKERNIYLTSEVLPKIKGQITQSDYKSYKVYFKNTFEKEFLDIVELTNSFSKVYNLSLYDCLIIIGQEQFLSINKFFTENGLKEQFPSTDHSPTLKLALKKLSDYFDKHKDKLKLFKQFDTDRNGYLSNDEFITFLNTFKDLELNDSQKIEILKIADKDKNGKIIPKEFLAFIKTIKMNDKKEEEQSQKPQLPIINSKVLNEKAANQESKIITDITLVKENLKVNKKILSRNKNEFLNHIVLLQEDICKNYNHPESIEQDFLLADDKKVGSVDLAKFSVILKKRLFVITKENFENFVNLAHDGLPKSIKNGLMTQQRIGYKNFLLNLTKYQYTKDKKDIKETKAKEILS